MNFKISIKYAWILLLCRGASSTSAQTNISPSRSENYILQVTPLSEVAEISKDTCKSVFSTDVDNIDIVLPSGVNALTTIQYYNAFGLPIEQVQVGITPWHHDLVSLVEYDGLQNITKRYLPISTQYVANECGNSGSGNSGNSSGGGSCGGGSCGNSSGNGSYHSAASLLSAATSQYSDVVPYSAISYEHSALQRPLSKTRAGSAYQSHPATTEYLSNNANEVILYHVGNDSSLVCDGFYAAGTLYKTTSRDEDGKQITTYTDKQQRTILQRKGNTASIYADTYFVYDRMNRIRFVLPPAIASTIGTQSLNAEPLRQYAYCYQYDERGNCTEKRLPGCEPIYMIYDNAGRMVLSQDGNQRQKGLWTFYVYDGLSRQIVSLEYADAKTTKATLQASWKNLADTIAIEYNDDLAIGFDIPYIITDSIKHIHTINYYDDYSFLQHSQATDSLQYDATKETTFGTRYQNATGSLTGSRTYLLDGSNAYIETTYYYDYRGRLIQQRSTNHFGGYDIVYTAYNFIGQPTEVLTTKSTNSTHPAQTSHPQQTPHPELVSGSPSSMVFSTREHYNYTYDHASRLIATTYQLNNDSPMTLNTMRYDELGRLACKTIYNSLDSISYNYDMRHQLTQIHAGSGFTENLYYNSSVPVQPGSAPLYNGNISAQTWTYGSQTNGYIYKYDNLNRLVNNTSILNGTWEDYKYTEEFNYDKNGNILTLHRFNAVDVMDGLYLTYDGNQLIRVDNIDTLAKPLYSAKRYQDFEKDEDIDMYYDKNGNLTADLDRQICTIQYNSLNLPLKIQFTNGNQITLTYDATGQKIATTYYTRKSTTTVPVGNILEPENNLSDYHVAQYAYHGNVVYKCTSPNISQQNPHADAGQHLLLSGTWTIDFIHNTEGYIHYFGDEEHYPYYQIKDHLGNIRETWIMPYPNTRFCDQRMQYYPSGLP